MGGGGGGGVKHLNAKFKYLKVEGNIKHRMYSTHKCFLTATKHPPTNPSPKACAEYIVFTITQEDFFLSETE